MTAANPKHTLVRRLRRRLLKPLARTTISPLRRWRNRHRTFEPIFIGGVMGSGTSLTAFSLAQRFESAGLIEESGHQVPRGSFLRVDRPKDFDQVGEYLESLRPRPQWSPTEGQRLLTQMYRGYARRPGRMIFDKGPNTNLLRARYLDRCFPDSRFVFVVRDPVATIEGLRRKWPLFGRESLDASIDFFETTHSEFLATADELAERVATINYEDLIDDYELSLEHLGAALGLEPSSRVRRLADRPNVPGQGIRNVRSGRIGLIGNANEAAYRRLDDREIRHIQTRLSELHRQCAALSVRSRPPAAAQ